MRNWCNGAIRASSNQFEPAGESCSSASKADGLALNEVNRPLSVKTFRLARFTYCELLSCVRYAKSDSTHYRDLYVALRSGKTLLLFFSPFRVRQSRQTTLKFHKCVRLANFTSAQLNIYAGASSILRDAFLAPGSALAPRTYLDIIARIPVGCAASCRSRENPAGELAS